MTPVHPFDALLFRRTLAAYAFATLVAAGVIVATDEATSTLGMRAARLAAFSPLLSACAILAVVGHAQSRGEFLGLVALGVSPWRVARGAAVAGLVAAALSIALVVSPWADVESLFPAVRASVDWVVDPAAGAAHAAGITVLQSGRITIAATGSGVETAATGALRALPFVAPLALLVPLWSTTPMTWPSRLGAFFLVAVTAVVSLHAIAAGRLAAVWGAVASLPLAASTVLGRRG